MRKVRVKIYDSHNLLNFSNSPKIHLKKASLSIFNNICLPLSLSLSNKFSHNRSQGVPPKCNLYVVVLCCKVCRLNLSSFQAVSCLKKFYFQFPSY